MSRANPAAEGYLNDADLPVLSTQQHSLSWVEANAERCLIRYDLIGDWQTETRFDGWASAWTVPLFFEARLFLPTVLLIRPKDLQKYRPLPAKTGQLERH
jgi:hypothetical protein